MVLESYPHKVELHKLGKSQIQSLSIGVANGFLDYNTRISESTIVIPAPSLFAFEQQTDSVRGEEDDVLQLPTVSSCATHLELLEVFYVLRQRILSSEEIDKAFGITPNRVEKVGHEGDRKTLKDETLWTRRQCKWPKYVEFAAVRFLAWREALNKREQKMTVEENGRLTLLHLPPIDVIMVWHSFMLNPRLFNETCQNEVLHRIRMPWKTVHKSINNRNWAFTLDTPATALFEEVLGVPCDLFEHFASWMATPGDDSTDSPQDINAFSLNTAHAHNQPPPTAISDASNVQFHQSNYTKMFRCADTQLALKLHDAVERQTAFVDKMNAHLWIRSPALQGTIRRAIGRYSNFLGILRQYRDKLVVPTLDIDLVWHTHQCTGTFYAKSMKAIVGRFINHDDSIVQEKLGTGFDESQKLYFLHFGKQYRMCGCWDCEALLSAVEDAAATASTTLDMQTIARQVQDEVNLYRAVEVAIRKKSPLAAEM